MTLDETLLNGLKAKKSEAFEILVHQLEGPLFRYFLCVHRDFHRAEEQVAETFLEFTRSVHKMQGSSEQLASYLFGIARNVRLRHWRRMSTDQATQQNQVDVEQLVDSKLSAYSSIETRDQIEQVLGMITQFDHHVRDVLLFRFVEGYSLQQISELLEIPLGSVKSNIHRGIAKLRQLLNPTDCHHE